LVHLIFNLASLNVPPSRSSTIFPYTTLFRSKNGKLFKTYEGQLILGGTQFMTKESIWSFSVENKDVYEQLQKVEGKHVRVYYKQDRKSTRLNSSHVKISYAVFCLKKKRTEQD